MLDRVKAAVKRGNNTYLDVKEAGCPKNADRDFCSPKEPADPSLKYDTTPYAILMEIHGQSTLFAYCATIQQSSR